MLERQGVESSNDPVIRVVIKAVSGNYSQKLRFRTLKEGNEKEHADYVSTTWTQGRRSLVNKPLAAKCEVTCFLSVMIPHSVNPLTAKNKLRYLLPISGVFPIQWRSYQWARPVPCTKALELRDTLGP
ncbi:hypothetical protein TNCV_3826501 [Trichonephila clavipes]|nr:hypothetical protein TNCV_3826501 [Trichonephila clavipes]